MEHQFNETSESAGFELTAEVGRGVAVERMLKVSVVNEYRNCHCIHAVQLIQRGLGIRVPRRLQHDAGGIVPYTCRSIS